jgi:chromosome segregation ATPase
MAAKGLGARFPSRETSMTTLQERVQSEFETLRQRRDELRVQLDLGKMEAADAWHEAEERWERLESKVRTLARESKDAAEDVGEAAKLLLDEVREAFDRMARHL